MFYYQQKVRRFNKRLVTNLVCEDGGGGQLDEGARKTSDQE